MSFHIVIPARYASTRFPGKPLALINDKPLIAHVVQAANTIDCISVTVATDHEDIAQAAATAGAEVTMTSAAHESGTDRLAEVARLKGWGDETLVVNIQGDEPEVDADLIQQLVTCAQRHPNAALATVVTPLKSLDDLHNPNVVKAVRLDDDRVLYFSRAPIPYNRDQRDCLTACYRHLGLYAYRVGALHAFANNGSAALENIEKLEQLRFMAMGETIVATEFHGELAAGIDTPEDLANYQQRLNQ
ncbi:3-deoxy-manno-octulosonate cytidylyltransferase [Salinibius halmophilus]|uniref:3-deoxy-manno-octulosonate cytidylyltransferase n=1 Tax=Salinibius halmophilus TaxID=1853216 RepID=UPI000E67639F|nr:3-deoxy-manno-octulosonate cytidylyltransferase [Salinibius halmophilus]